MRAIRNTPNLNVGFDTLAVSPCADLQNLMDQYGVDNINDLILAMNKDLLDKYGVSTMEELRVAMEKEKMEALEKKIEVGAADIADLSYYMFNSSRMRWINVDALSKLPGERKDMLTNLPSDQSTDCKLVFEKVKGIIPAFAHAANFYFGEVPMKNECWIIGMRYGGGKAYLSIELTESKPKYEGFNFKEMSPDQIKEAMKVIN